MAYDITSQGPTPLEVIGTFAPIERGVVALSTGTIVVTCKRLARIEQVFVSAQSANPAYVSAISGNTFTIVGTSSDVIMWMAVGKGRF